MYLSIALSRLETDMDVTLNTSASTMIRVSFAVSAAFSASKPLYTRLTSGRASATISADTTSDASANRLMALLAKWLECSRLRRSRSSVYSGISVAEMQELNSSTGR